MARRRVRVRVVSRLRKQIDARLIAHVLLEHVDGKSSGGSSDSDRKEHDDDER